MKFSIATLTLAVGAGLVAGTADAGNIFSEDFDALTGGGAALIGQGGWALQGGNSNFKVKADPGLFGFSGNAVGAIGSSEVRHALDAPMDDTNVVTASYDIQIKGDGTYAYLLLRGAAASSVSIGIERQSITMREASGGTKNFDHNLPNEDDKTYRFTLTIDPTAFGGAGSASATIAAYTAENTLGAATTAFSNIELRLDEAGRALSSVDRVVLRAHQGPEPHIDNISIDQVPEPGSLALLGLGGLLIARRRRG